MNNWYFLAMVNSDFYGCKLFKDNRDMWFITRHMWWMGTLIDSQIAQCTSEAAARAAFALLRNGPEAYFEHA